MLKHKKATQLAAKRSFIALKTLLYTVSGSYIVVESSKLSWFTSKCDNYKFTKLNVYCVMLLGNNRKLYNPNVQTIKVQLWKNVLCQHNTFLK